MKTRLKKSLTVIFTLLAIGIAYYVWVKLTGIAIPCIFKEKYGFYCSGCGISRMFLNLFRFDFYGAFRSNILIFVLSPVLSLYTAYKIFEYIKYGNLKLSKKENIFVWFLIALLVVFGILRNIPMFSYLAPQ